tara:strand:+ start:23 stop:166 length:144 start_codon:yes stop_codon:yes gene_type:complete
MERINDDSFARRFAINARQHIFHLLTAKHNLFKAPIATLAFIIKDRH